MIPTRSRPEGQGREQSTKQRYEYNANKKRLMCKLKPSHSAPPPPPPPHLNPRSLGTFLAGYSEEETSSSFLKSLHSWVTNRVVYWNPRCLGVGLKLQWGKCHNKRPDLVGGGLCIARTRPGQEDSCSPDVCEAKRESGAEQTRTSHRTQIRNTDMNHYSQHHLGWQPWANHKT